MKKGFFKADYLTDKVNEKLAKEIKGKITLTLKL